jgi:NADH-quinone oxidoreductase subunit M
VIAALAAGPASDAAFPLLTALILVPAAGAVLTLLIPDRRPELTRVVGYVTSAATFGLAVYLLVQFDTSSSAPAYQFVSNHQWMPALGIRWTLGVDGISLFMVALTALLIPVSFLASAELEKPKAFTFWMLLLEMSVMGVFLALDAIVFFIFFELVLVPMYFLIAGWGHGNRRYAAVKFYIFTAAGSAFLFVGILGVAFLHQHDTGQLTFSVPTLTHWAQSSNALSLSTAKWLFVAFAIGFAVKIPLIPFHTWLPDAHTDAPTAGSVVLAGVLLKMGTYGFLRFAIPMFPQAAVDLAPVLLVLAILGITYGAIVAAMQPNLKRIIAYSSIAHLGFVVVGIFAFTSQGISGGLFTMLSHGLTTGALFLLVGMLYDRRHTYELKNLRGLWKAVPIFGGLFIATTFASIGLPGFSGFVGEFLSLLGAFLSSRWYAVVATTGVILAAVYMLWAVQRAFTGVPDEENAATGEIRFREICTVVPLLGLSLFLGFYPKPVLDRLEPSVVALVNQVDTYSNHHKPVVNLAAEECVADAKGRYTVTIASLQAAAGSSQTLQVNGQVKPCEAGGGGG